MTLEIVEGIMKACADYFASFAPTVVKIMLLFSEAAVGAETSTYLHTLVWNYCKMDATGRDNTLSS